MNLDEETRQFNEYAAKKAREDRERAIDTGIEHDTAQNRLYRVGQYRIARAPAAACLALADTQEIPQSELASDFGQRLAAHQTCAQPAELALAQPRKASVQLFRNTEIKQRVTEELETFVVVRAKTAMRECEFQQLAADETVTYTGFEFRETTTPLRMHRESGFRYGSCRIPPRRRHCPSYAPAPRNWRR